MLRQFWSEHGWVLAWLALVAASLVVRGPLPVDETRYLSVAWEMWLRGDWLVPHLNGDLYTHKPPLLFWLMHLGWAVFGVTDWWPRLVPALAALATVWLTRRLSQAFWPGSPEIARLAPWIVVGSFFWALFTPMLMFDMVLTAAVALGVGGLVRAGRAPQHWGGWLVLGAALGAGGLTKGPVILLHLLPLSLLGPWWSPAARERLGRWYLGVLVAVLAGLAVALVWLVPAALRGGPEYQQAILWHQTANRMVESFAHQRPVWWYLPLLPILLFPWSVWVPAWRGLGALRWGMDPGLRLVAAWIVPVVVGFSLISGKQPHYLLPLFPAFALLFARQLSRHPFRSGCWARWLPGLVLIGAGAALASLPWWGQGQLSGQAARLEPAWGLAIVALGILVVGLRQRSPAFAVIVLSVSTVAAVCAANAAVFRAAWPLFELRSVAQQLQADQQAGRAVAYLGKYHGQFHFLGRLERPIAILDDPRALRHWAAAHPRGRVIRSVEKPQHSGAAGLELQRRYRGRWLELWRASALVRVVDARKRGRGDQPVLRIPADMALTDRSSGSSQTES